MADRTAVLSWDWKGQPDLDELGRELQRLSAGKVRLYQVDTGSDEYAIVLSAGALTPDEVQAVWHKEWEG